MRFRSRKAKPPVGMEMTATFSMGADQDAQQAAEALVKFFEAIDAAAKDLKAAWISIHCSGIPEEFEATLQKALDTVEKRPALKIVVDNTKSAAT